MMIFKHFLVKVPTIPMLAIRSFYYNKINKSIPNSQAVYGTECFQDGYYRALKDLGIPKKYWPK